MAANLNAFVVADPRKCIGCKVCEVACAVAHSDLPVTTAGTMTTPIIPKLYLVRTAEVTMPIQCRHCEDAPCGNACPVGAITQKDGMIYVDQAACIGCKTCVVACPFGAMEMVPLYQEGRPVVQLGLKAETADGLVDRNTIVANKCDLCTGRAGGPACVEVCPKEALEMVTPAAERRKRNEEAALAVLQAVKKFVG